MAEAFGSQEVLGSQDVKVYSVSLARQLARYYIRTYILSQGWRSSMTRLLITGINGTIGQVLKGAFQEVHDLYGLDRAGPFSAQMASNSSQKRLMSAS